MLSSPKLAFDFAESRHFCTIAGNPKLRFKFNDLDTHFKKSSLIHLFTLLPNDMGIYT